MVPYELEEDVEDNIRAFSYMELEQFRNYVVPNTWNFGGGKNYFTVSEGGIPVKEIYDLVPNERKMFPDYLILKPNPTLQKSFLISPFMEIVLVNERGLEHSDYNLQFGVVGKIIGKNLV